MSDKKHSAQTEVGEGDHPLYGRRFFTRWGSQNEEYVRSARAVAELIFDQYRPQSILDLGCGAGVHAARMQELGARIICADANACPVEYRAEAIDTIEEIDLSRDIESTRFERVDMVLCLDVAEHLPAADAGTLVRNCTLFSDLVLFSAAPPFQGGDGHINEQPRRYWISHFRDCDFRHCRREAGWLDLRGLAVRDVLTLRWMITQVAVFRRGLRFPYPAMALPGIKAEGG